MNKILTTYLIAAVLGFAGTLAFNGIAKAEEKPRFYYRHINSTGAAVVAPEPEPEPEEKDEKIRVAFTNVDADVYKKNGFHNAGARSIMATLGLRANISDESISKIRFSGKTCFGTTCSPAQFILSCVNKICTYSDSEFTISISQRLTEKMSAADFLNQLLTIEIDTVFRAYDTTNTEVDIAKFDVKTGKYEQPFFYEWLYSVPNITADRSKITVGSNALLENMYMKKNAHDEIQIFSDFPMQNEYVFNSIDDELLHKNVAMHFFR